MAIGAFVQLLCYAIQAPKPPFPVMVFSYALAGLGMSLQVNLFVLLTHVSG
jgi:hypothetical protein